MTQNDTDKKDSKRLTEATKAIPVRELNSRKDVEDWLKETSEDDE